MKRKAIIPFLGLFGALILSSCGNLNQEEQPEDILTEEGLLSEPFDMGATKEQFENADKAEDHILVKAYEKTGLPDLDILSSNGITSISSLGGNSRWYQADLAEGVDVVSTVKSLREANCFETVDYDYICKSEDLDYKDVTYNPMASSQAYFQSAKIQEAWQYMEEQGKAGGDPSVTIAVIDTGVDYEHEDLRENMWTNTGEIPGNGIDDDGDGYIDDVYGANTLDGVYGTDAGDPMDDHGHGTHVAGIIAATNNNRGSVGVAYNCKIMAIKAGNSSGYFTSSAIAKAVSYAYEHGADVINMSFGGTGLSLAEQEAMKVAYERCVMVASAGNDSLLNEPAPLYQPTYPAALPYVVGVMSESTSHFESAFTNHDLYADSQIEYDVYAPGEAIYSCLPNNNYAAWSGTSMASPVVAGVAALLRSLHIDRNEFPTKAVMAQLVNTSETSVACIHNYLHNVPNGLDAYLALTKYPEPRVRLYNYYTFDNVTDDDDDDGAIDAGETINLGVVLKNKGGVAKDVNVSIDVKREGGTVDRYVSPTISQVTLQNIGTYSTQDCGEIVDEETNEITGVETPLQVKIADNCPNDYLCDINVTITWKNGLDETDETIYSDDTGVIQIAVTRGVLLPNVISEDMTLTSDNLYIINKNSIVEENVTLTIDPGVTIQAYVNNTESQVSDSSGAKFLVNGNFIAKGTEDAHITFKPSELYPSAAIVLNNVDSGNGVVDCEWCDFTNLSTYGTYNGSRTMFKNCRFEQYNMNGWTYTYGQPDRSYISYDLRASSLEFCTFDEVAADINAQEIKNCSFNGCYVGVNVNNGVFSGNLIVGESKKATWSNSLRFSLYVYLPCTSTSTWNEETQTSDWSYTYNYNISNNVFFIKPELYPTSNSTLHISSSTSKKNLNIVDWSNNYFYGLTADQLGDVFYDYYDDATSSIARYTVNSDTLDWSTTYPIALDAHFEDAEGNVCRTIGSSTYKCVVTMSRDMDTSIPLKVCFGSVEPYADYVIEGDYVEDSKTVWEGSYTLDSKFESGINYFTIYNGRADDNHALELIRDSRISFKIDTTSAQSMNLSATADIDGVHLSWFQDDYPTIAGYNIYKSTALDGKYTKVNKQLLNYDVTEYLDSEVEPGVTYYYNFTVVLSDMSESKPSGKTVVTTYDSMAPNVYHTPVSVAYLGYNLIISATVTDNVGAQSVTLYYRVKGQSEYREAAMSPNNSKYSALIPASFVTSSGIEYYIDAYDGINHTYSGSSLSPHQVIVQSKVSENEKGDVDGNGSIDLYDALLTIRAANDLENLSNDEFDRADLNSDGHLTADEALLILQYANGTITSFSSYL